MKVRARSRALTTQKRELAFRSIRVELKGAD
jgi:hypothetical protein